MYGLMLAAAMTATTTAPDFGCFGCRGSHVCYGCHGYYGYNAFSGCWGCSGCRGCSGCWGCTGCWGCSGCWGCTGCWGGVIIVHPVSPVPACHGAHRPPQPGVSPRERELEQKVKDLEQKLKEMEKKMKGGKQSEKGKEASGGEVARVTVRLPADARLWVDDVLCPLTSARRSFTTPPLQPDVVYTYTLWAEVVRDGQTVARSKRVTLQAGKEVDVDFGDMTPALSARR